MPLPAPEQIILQSARLMGLKKAAPPELTEVLTAIEDAIEKVSYYGAADSERSQIVSTDSGRWYVSRYARDGVVWVSVTWPSGAASGLGAWLRFQALTRNLASDYSYVPQGQIWIYLGSKL